MSEPHEEETSKENTKIPEIPEESIKEIMFLLPVKSLLKFRCLSPSWLSFIDSDYFMKAHLSKATPKILLNAPEATMVLDIDPMNPKNVAHASAFKLCYPHLNTIILGSCNSVLLSHSNDKNFDKLEPFDRKDVVLQNPSTRTFHKVPFMEIDWPKNMICAGEKFIYCLGYDALTDDYKVFRNCQLYGWSSVAGGSPFYSHVTDYSMKKKSYREIEPCPYYIHCNVDASVFVGGALHWVVTTGSEDISQFIALFNVATEEYKVVEQPLYSSEKFQLFLIVLEGCLTAISHSCSREHVEVWVMKEYGNVKSWSKIVSLMAADIGLESINFLRPLLYSKCKKKLLMLLDGDTMIWYDLEKKSREIVQLNFQWPNHFSTHLYLESLVKLHGPGPWEEKRGAEYNDEKPKKVPKKRDDFLSKGFKLKL